MLNSCIVSLVLPAVSRSDYNAVLIIMQCRAPPHLVIVVWRGLTTALLVGGMGVEKEQNGHLGPFLFSCYLILCVWPQENSTNWKMAS